MSIDVFVCFLVIRRFQYIAYLINNRLIFRCVILRKIKRSRKKNSIKFRRYFGVFFSRTFNFSRNFTAVKLSNIKVVAEKFDIFSWFGEFFVEAKKNKSRFRFIGAMININDFFKILQNFNFSKLFFLEKILQGKK